ncbi:DEAD/DEAH box helicase isoform X2 [Wolffia australiana]
MEALPWRAVASSQSSLRAEVTSTQSSSRRRPWRNVMYCRHRISFHSGSCSWLVPLRSLHPCSSRNRGLKSSISCRFARETSTSGKQLSDAEDYEDEEEDDEDDDDDDDEAAAEYITEESPEFSEEDDGVGVVVASDDGFGVGDDVRTERFEEHKWQRVSRLLAEVREYGEEIIDYSELAGIYDFPLDKFQQAAIRSFLDGSSVVVSVPTSSGKTLIAECAGIATVARGRRLFYTTPLKALSNQKYREFRETFGENSVGLLTGDTAINKDAPIMIMTTEILRNMLYQSIGMISSGSRLFEVDVIVLDEVHYLSDISRGTVWEEIVIYCPKEVQLICLSATVANPDELAGWIGEIHGKTDLVTSGKRPVPLTWHFSLKNSLLPLLDEKGRKMNRKLSIDYIQLSSPQVESYRDSASRKRNSRRDKNEQIYSGNGNISRPTILSKNDVNIMRRSQTPLIRDTLRQLQARDMLPAIWFIFSRKGCDAAVQYMEDSNLLDEYERVEVELALRRFKVKYPDAVRENAVKGLLNGVASHHAGSLPLWKSFIEELFQRGLVKVVFATETLAAGINMPARTAVIASLSKRKENGRSLLSSNELHQMAGRAGRRGIDEKGHVVLVQTPYEGAEECFELLSAGLEPLVSQFSASYGMVLNLLAGEKVTTVRLKESEAKSLSSGRTLDEARKLIEQSFGNYVGSNVMVSAKEEIRKIQQEIEILSSEVSDDSIDRKCQEQLSEADYSEISQLQEELRAEKKVRLALRRKMELERMVGWRPVLESSDNSNLPFICLQYKDNEGVQQLVSAVYIGKVDSFPISETLNTVYMDQDSEDGVTDASPGYVALGSDNTWYLFSEKWIKTLHKTGFPNVAVSEGGVLPLDSLRGLFVKEPMQWEKLAKSEFGPLLSMVGSLETWSWSLNVPVLSSLSEDDEIKPWSETYQSAVESYREQKKKVSRLKKRITGAKGFKEFKRIIDQVNFTKEKIQRLDARSKRLIKRIEQIEPSGWKEFLQVTPTPPFSPAVVHSGTPTTIPAPSLSLLHLLPCTYQRHLQNWGILVCCRS